ncbi:MAG: hypothetical protein RXR39_04595 [Caldivirga sp.]
MKPTVKSRPNSDKPANPDQKPPTLQPWAILAPMANMTPPVKAIANSATLFVFGGG